ncbi:DotH/IcmK family type IV secretion protein [Halomonas elongata]|uniref:DotH/IcmK family type IV secretion protein n=1 Tax=Halomonas elongata TaxID=2746 RepID=UPI00255AFB35|nr:DotH/IcmK family type IV secretion protein [Halomonas elongata]MDL4860781.1 DotH/IcmK family type IV secretion protein [Halomonas elongata]
MTMDSTITFHAAALFFTTVLLSSGVYAQEQLTEPATAEEAAQQGWVPAAARTNQGRATQPATAGQGAPTGGVGFPEAPGAQQARQSINGQKMAGYGTQQYHQQGQSPYGTADLMPLPPPSQLEDAKNIVSPLTPNQITDLRDHYEDTRRAAIARPVSGEGKIRSTSVELAPGSAIPELRTMPNELSTLVFVDSTGAPWPLAASPRVSRNDLFDVNWLGGTNMVTVSPLTSYNEGSLTVVLEDMPIPVSVKISTIDPTSNASEHYYDSRHDLRIPGRGPNAKSPTTSNDQIALYDQVLQSFLDGLPPSGSQPIEIIPSDNDASAWTYEGSLYIRTPLPIRSSFERTLSSADGTHVYQLPVTPFVALSSEGRTVTLKLDI